MIERRTEGELPQLLLLPFFLYPSSSSFFTVDFVGIMNGGDDGVCWQHVREDAGWWCDDDVWWREKERWRLKREKGGQE